MIQFNLLPDVKLEYIKTERTKRTVIGISILAGVVAHPGLLEFSRLRPVVIAHDPWSSARAWLLTGKWLFVTVWSAYGAEIASTLVAEMRDADRRASRALHAAGAIGIVGVGTIPFLMLALVGTARLTEDPLVAFLPVADAVLGNAGRTLVGVMFAAALILGAQAFVIGSSRTIYQMTCDGYLPRQFARTNRRGVPVGSMLWDVTAISVLLALFGTNVVSVVAAANVGYLVVFVLMPVAFILLERRALGERRRRFTPMMALAAALSIFNALLLVIGGIEWGSGILLAGAIGIASIVPITFIRRVQDRRRGCLRLPPFPAGEPSEASADPLATAGG